MKAILITEAGSVDNLFPGDIEQPVAKENDVLVEVKAISINPVDIKVRRDETRMSKMFGEERPIILGWDIAGTVAAVGGSVTRFKKGDRVFGMVNFPGRGQAYAEFVAANENHLAKMPGNVSYEEAAASTLAALTTLQALQGGVKKGDRVLIHAGSGGVGHFAIQIAKQLGAYVITTTSAKNRDFVLSMGADEHVDYKTQKFEDVVSDVDFVLDPYGGDVLDNSIKVLNDGGSIVSLAARVFPEELLEQRKINAAYMMVHSNGEDMQSLAGWLESEIVKAHVSKTFPFSEMKQAHLAIETGRTVGKVVVTV